MYDEEKLAKKAKRKRKGESKKKDESVVAVKRVNFPWLAKPMACRAKAYIAFVADSQCKRARRIGNRKKFFDAHILPRVWNRFPKLHGIVSDYYADKGRSLSVLHFEELLRARYMNMYTGDMEHTHEHPLQSDHPQIKSHYLKLVGRKR